MSDETTTTDLGQPFAPGGVFAGGNVRLGKPTAKDQAENERADTELRDSMRAAGWLASAGPVVKDEHGTVLVGHRRARIAAELAEELGADISLEHTVEIPFGEGAEADLARLREALLSNTGAGRSAPPTAENWRPISRPGAGRRTASPLRSAHPSRR